MRKSKGIFYVVFFFGLIFLALWVFVMLGNDTLRLVEEKDIQIARRNLLLPTSIFLFSSFLLILDYFVKKLSFPTLVHRSIKVGLIALVVFDLFRFGWKFTPFTNSKYIFPNTKVISFLKEKSGIFRIMTTDSRIFPPNFSAFYRVQSVDGYDPLYLRRYAELIAASERGKADINPPFGFNRIITPHNFNSKIIDLLGVKYILSLSDIETENKERLAKVFQEGETRVYENKQVLPRVFFVNETKFVKSKNEAILEMMREDFDPAKTAVVEEENSPGALSKSPPKWTKGKAELVKYSENQVVVQTDNTSDGFLVLTDSFYPIWYARIDGKETRIYRTDFAFRGIIVPAGKHRVEFYNTLELLRNNF